MKFTKTKPRGKRRCHRVDSEKLLKADRGVKLKNARRPTITFEELKRLSFRNSKKLPQKVVVEGTVRDWVGIGWVDTGEAPTDPNIPVVIDG
jgi:hypothetical protein